MSIAAMKLALEALHKGKVACEWGQAHDHVQQITQAMNTLRQSIQQAEQAQPVAHTLNCVCGATWDIKADGREEMVNSPDAIPPQRQPLTETAIRTIRCDMAGTLDVQYVAFARAIEAAHGIKGKA
jgi:hypothetical protein